MFCIVICVHKRWWRKIHLELCGEYLILCENRKQKNRRCINVVTPSLRTFSESTERALSGKKHGGQHGSYAWFRQVLDELDGCVEGNIPRGKMTWFESGKSVDGDPYLLFLRA